MVLRRKSREIIFCQGDKKELEEITGEDYEYLKLVKPRCNMRASTLTYIEVNSPDRSRIYMAAFFLDNEFYFKARQLDADAVILLYSKFF